MLCERGLFGCSASIKADCLYCLVQSPRTFPCSTSNGAEHDSAPRQPKTWRRTEALTLQSASYDYLARICAAKGPVSYTQSRLLNNPAILQGLISPKGNNIVLTCPCGRSPQRELPGIKFRVSWPLHSYGPQPAADQDSGDQTNSRLLSRAGFRWPAYLRTSGRCALKAGNVASLENLYRPA